MPKQNIECRYCKEVYSFEIREEGLAEWINGEFIQNALPELSDGQRELLLSGTCDTCWEKFFGDEDEI